MPEEPEIETENLHEMIVEKKEEAEHAGSRASAWISGVAVSTAIIAALAALASLHAGDTVNQALLDKTRASILETERTNTWMHYQSKSTRELIAEATSEILASQPGRPELDAKVRQYRADSLRYASDKEALLKQGDELHRQVHELDEHAELSHRAHERFAPAVTFFQVAIALSAISVLTRRRVIWYGSLLLAFCGIGYFWAGVRAMPEPLAEHAPAPGASPHAG